MLTQLQGATSSRPSQRFGWELLTPFVRGNRRLRLLCAARFYRIYLNNTLTWTTLQEAPEYGFILGLRLLISLFLIFGFLQIFKMLFGGRLN